MRNFIDDITFQIEHIDWVVYGVDRVSCCAVVVVVLAFAAMFIVVKGF